MHLLISALFHDVGKNGVDEGILRNPEALNKTEYGKMQTHTEKTEWLLSHCNGFRHTPIPFIAGSHHERLDGTGYPRGLSGETLHRLARIITVADIWDALMHERSYKEEYPPSTSLLIMEELRGTSCDPLFTKTLISLV
jgi:HD-GYP domain-containing protein (c-di-GMP phosphodiesterase class II)